MFLPLDTRYADAAALPPTMMPAASIAARRRYID